MRSHAPPDRLRQRFLRLGDAQDDQPIFGSIGPDIDQRVRIRILLQLPADRHVDAEQLLRMAECFQAINNNRAQYS
jgi:hypothetical protein